LIWLGLIAEGEGFETLKMATRKGMKGLTVLDALKPAHNEDRDAGHAPILGEGDLRRGDSARWNDW
jgi:hypothetical protein